MNEWDSVSVSLSCAFSWVHFLLLDCFVLFQYIFVLFLNYILGSCLLSNQRQKAGRYRCKKSWGKNCNQDILCEIYLQ